MEKPKYRFRVEFECNGCKDCYFGERVSDGQASFLACVHPGSPDGYSNLLNEYMFNNEMIPDWCPVAKGGDLPQKFAAD